MTYWNRPLDEEPARNEVWLAGFPAPAPSAAALASVKAAVRAELSRPADAAHTPRVHPVTWRTSGPWSRLAGAFAAAALIAISVGVIRFQSPGRALRTAAAERTVEEFVTTLAAVLDDRDEMLVRVDRVLDSFESEEGQIAGGTSRPATPSVNDLLDEFDQLWEIAGGA